MEIVTERISVPYTNIQMVHTYQRSCLFSGDRLWPYKHSISYLHLTFSSSSERISNPAQFHQSQTNIRISQHISMRLNILLKIKKAVHFIAV